MRYIKTYESWHNQIQPGVDHWGRSDDINLFENITDDNILDLEDIFSEVKDMGYEYRISKKNKTYNITIRGYENVSTGPGHHASRPKRISSWNELKEYVNRTRDYLTSIGVRTSEMYLYINGYRYNSSNGGGSDDKDIHSIDIYFRKHIDTVSESISADIDDEEMEDSIKRKHSEDHETTEDVKDICIELQDEGFDIKFYDGFDVKILKIIKPSNVDSSTTFSKTSMFNTSEVEEVVNRIVRYLGENIIETAVYIGETIHPDDGAWVGLDKFESSGFMTTGVKIIFKS